MSPFLKGASDYFLWVWLAAAAFAVLGFVTRLALQRSGERYSTAIAALEPTRLGAALAVAIGAFLLVLAFVASRR